MIDRLNLPASLRTRDANVLVRSSGIGSALMRWVVERAATDREAALVQLTSDAAREDAHRFSRRLGFVDSPVGVTFHVTLPASAAR